MTKDMAIPDFLI